ncbi:TetR/AcrR family transcriptional regulator [Clostridium saccharoperbutylacetonicum]|uniref:TetR/AcrR family transcriptional regulator n=1 Tax=Clostridium saccharoperbutylacetonicum TaxID=36745 RepID=UPI000983AFD2|nr:TetR/AcrR family transcriptional regulator [Clostridium saccharoperbutylacetonicum]AQR94504.1 DNA-binding transcriptional repressor AcrR [Clostridium saccharoperbutylacetonicum]NSB30339.1 AcrR family transcriptional regulator [Clostridium saccharoperbutylacetonicum]
MQYAKNEIRQRIINIAREEFLENGFEKASIRTITAKAKTSKSNLYNYFKDKDDLFYCVVEKTIIRIKKGIELAEELYVSKGVHFYTKEEQEFVVSTVSEFVHENLIEVKLLLFRAQGSALESFKFEVIEAFTDIMCKWVKTMVPDKSISRNFIRSISNFYLSIIEQNIIHGQANDNKEFIDFIYNGWKSVLQ